MTVQVVMDPFILIGSSQSWKGEDLFCYYSSSSSEKEPIMIVRRKSNLVVSGGALLPKLLRRRDLSTFVPRLAGKVAVITGAASGVGKASASEFIKNGAKVILADIQHDLGEAAAAELGPDAAFVRCDVTDESQVAATVDHAVAKHGRLDIMYNNAGIAGSLAPSIVDLDLGDFDRTFAVNVRSVMAGIKHAARVMIPRRAGCILCTGSVTAIMGGLAPSDYSVSKSAVVGAARAAAAELGLHGIRVNCISPHALATPFGIVAMRKFFPGLEEGQLAAMVEATGELEGAVCEAADVARAAVFLASDEAKYISGHNMVVDGGLTVSKRLDISPPS